jgi:two-component system, chemotaxis family, protein-glutamate methylesterase/glutaminase
VIADVIAIGGSAGALDVLLAILRALPGDFAIPLVVVLHVPPAQPSMLPELLRHASRRAVHEIEDKQQLHAGAVHVAPPNYHVLLERDRTLALSVDAPVNFSRPSIDVAFESAAAALGAGVVGLVLSGANDDGARGLACIHAAGGLAIIQAPETAQYSAMPAAACRRVPAARIVSAGELAGVLAALVGRQLP